MSSRTTHSDLARAIRVLSATLAKLPGSTPGADLSSRELLLAGASALEEQDHRIDTMTIALRISRTALRQITRSELGSAGALAAAKEAAAEAIPLASLALGGLARLPTRRAIAAAAEASP